MQIGYCLGGMLVMDLARAGKPELKGVVSFHGMLDSIKLEVMMHLKTLSCATFTFYMASILLYYWNPSVC